MAFARIHHIDSWKFMSAPPCAIKNSTSNKPELISRSNRLIQTYTLCKRIWMTFFECVQTNRRINDLSRLFDNKHRTTYIPEIILCPIGQLGTYTIV